MRYLNIGYTKPKFVYQWEIISCCKGAFGRFSQNEHILTSSTTRVERELLRSNDLCIEDVWKRARWTSENECGPQLLVKQQTSIMTRARKDKRILLQLLTTYYWLSQWWGIFAQVVFPRSVLCNYTCCNKDPVPTV